MQWPPFIDWNLLTPFQLSPGVWARTPHGQNIMLSLVELDENAEVPGHHHPHEQAGIVLEGLLQLTIGEQTTLVAPGQAYLIPPLVQHGARAVGGPVKVLDVFSPIREDYAARMGPPPTGASA